MYIPKYINIVCTVCAMLLVCTCFQTVWCTHPVEDFFSTLNIP